MIEKAKYHSKTEGTEFLNLRSVIENNQSRESTGSKELDRVLGGGLVRGVVALVGGDLVLVNRHYFFRHQHLLARKIMWLILVARSQLNK